MFPPVLYSFQIAGTLSDGLGKTMDNRHQSEREYIRYHAATSGEHLVAGIHGLAHGESCDVRLHRGSSVSATRRCVLLIHLQEEMMAWYLCVLECFQALWFCPPWVKMLQPVRTLHSFSKCCTHCSSFFFSDFCPQSVLGCK